MSFKKFLDGDNRTIKAKKNIIASIILKGIDGLVYLLLVPVTLGYLNQYEYGIWLTLSSILMWINSFDIGLGNGMRNKLAISIANSDFQLGKIYVSTTFFMLTFVMSGIIILGFISSFFLDWYKILNVAPSLTPHLNEIVLVSLVIFCINFIFKFIGNIYLALQLPAINNLLVVLGNCLSLLFIYIIKSTTAPNLFYIVLAYSIAPLLIYISAYPITFYKLYPKLRPSGQCFKLNYFKDLLGIGIQFFILQISSIVIFSITNLLISHIFGPEEVTPYNIAYRYFSVILMISNLILAPIWSATTDAYAKGDLKWIKNAINKIHKILLIITGCTVFMFVISSHIYKVWIGTDIIIPTKLSMLVALYVCILIWSLSYSNFLNGLGKLRVQVIMAITIAILFIPTCYIMARHYGIEGILINMCVLNFIVYRINKFQFNAIIENRAIGIWNK